MPIFNPFSTKSKVGQPKKWTSSKEEMSYKSHEEDMLTHLGNLQLEVSRLHNQLASIQSQQNQARAKEEISTQRSHQTFSTIGTTQLTGVNRSSGSYPRPTGGSRQTPSPRFHDRHKPQGDYSSRDRPPPVTQIFIPTPSISFPTSASYSNESDYYDIRNMTESVTWMDDGRRSHLRHYQSTDINLGGDYDVVPRYVRTEGIPAEFVPKHRQHTGSAWQQHHSASHPLGPSGRTSTDRIRVRNVQRYSTHSSNSRYPPSVQKGFHQQPVPLDEQVEYTYGDHVHVPRTVNRVHKCDEEDQGILSNNRRQDCVVWLPTELSEEGSQVSSNEKVYDNQIPCFKVAMGEEPQHQQPCRNSRYKTRESSSSQSYQCNHISLESSSVGPSWSPPHGAKAALSSATHKGIHDNKISLSQIRKQRANLKPPSDRPEKTPLPKDDVDILFEAIQNGVTLKHVEKPIKNSDHQHTSKPSAMLLQLQERKKAFRQDEGVK